MTIKAHQNGAVAGPLHLTPAECRVLLLLPTHLTLDAIAERLGRQRSTVKTHVAHIYEKLGANTRAEAVARGRNAGLLADPDPAASGTSPRARHARRSTDAVSRPTRTRRAQMGPGRRQP